MGLASLLWNIREEWYRFNEKGEKLYRSMVLLKNTHGKPDGANLWYKERDSFWLEDFNDEFEDIFRIPANSRVVMY